MKEKKHYVCTECDYQSPKWLGCCPSCKSWNTMVEEIIKSTPANSKVSVMTTPSTIVFQELQDVHFPIHLGKDAPHSEHT